MSLDAPYADSPDAYHKTGRHPEDPLQKLMSEFKEAFGLNPPVERIDLAGNVSFVEGEGGQRAVRIPFPDEDSQSGIAPFLGYPWIGAAMDADMSGLWDVVFGDTTQGAVTNPPAGMEQFHMLVAALGSFTSQFEVICDGDLVSKIIFTDRSGVQIIIGFDDNSGFAGIDIGTSSLTAQILSLVSGSNTASLDNSGSFPTLNLSYSSGSGTINISPFGGKNLSLKAYTVAVGDTIYVLK